MPVINIRLQHGFESTYFEIIPQICEDDLLSETRGMSGMAGKMPLKLAVKPLDDHLRPTSETAEFVDLVPAAD